MKIDNLKKLLLEEMRDLYSAEKQLVTALPKMAKAATNEELKESFKEHLEQTRGHVERLEKAFELIGQSARAKKCKAMEGLIEEGKEMMEEDIGNEELDAALISAAQKVEHYEIASYGTICTWAKTLKLNEVGELLGETLSEEKATDSKLTKLAKSSINLEAAATAG